MPKQKVILIAVVCVVLGLAVGAFVMRPRPEKVDVDRNPPQQSDAVPQVVTRTLPPEDNSRYSIDVAYPELSGLSVGGVRDKVNGEIRTAVYDEVAAFRSANASNLPLGDQDLKSSFVAQFDVALVSRSFFSVLMSYSDYSAGAAHPTHYLVAYNYDLKTGDAVNLREFFESLRPSQGYMDRLGRHVKAELARQLGSEPETVEVIASGAAPTFENYARFTLDSEELSIHFDPYQVGPYAAGSPVVKIGYGELVDSILKPAADQAASSSARWWLE